MSRKECKSDKMLDFVAVRTMSPKKGEIDVYPEFLVNKAKDIMVKGRSFYAVWDEHKGMWSKNEEDVQELVDYILATEAKKLKEKTDEKVTVKYLKNFSSKKWTEFQNYYKSLPDHYHELDTSITFQNSEITKTSYVSHVLPYEMVQMDTPAYNKLTSVLYSEEELRKIEWAIGAIISGDSKKIQKFLVLYGAPGTGKSTMIDIIQELFTGYYSVFDSKALGNSNNAFSLEPFKMNPLVAIQHDGDLSRIEDNTKLNSIISHEALTVNEKFKPTYSNRFNSFLIMGTNKPVRITDSKSGIIRRLIDVHPTGEKIKASEYYKLIDDVKYELGGIAYHCLKVYESLGKNYYNDYIPISMMNTTNNVYSFIEEEFEWFTTEEEISLNAAWMRYKNYCLDANIQYPLNKLNFKEELKTYFTEFKERTKTARNIYKGFRPEKFNISILKKDDGSQSWIILKEQHSKLDDLMKDFPAQYATKDGLPKKPWSEVNTLLKDLDSRRQHYVNGPAYIICVDLDLKNELGEKDLELNLKEADKFPPTYAEVSKSGKAIHLYYIYTGDPGQLSTSYGPNVEIKVFNGNSALRRKLTLCNNLDIATISSGLPLKEQKMVSEKEIKDQAHLVALIKKGLNKEVFPNTKPSIDYISMILNQAYDSGMIYDVEDLRGTIRDFALTSTNQKDYCLKEVMKMPFKSKQTAEEVELEDLADAPVNVLSDEMPLIIFDVEVFPNLFICCWKIKGAKGKSARHKMINPTPDDIKELCKNRLVGFNNRDYDNHILWARMMGYTNMDLFKLSQKIIDKDQDFKGFKQAKSLSYTDVYDFLSAKNKMSLKKWEIKLRIKHNELGLPWDQPVPEKLWDTVAEYCCDDVDATEAVWDENVGDWEARLILSKLSGLSVNCTTNTHTCRIIVGNDKHPQSKFIYTDLSKEFPGYRFDKFGIDRDDYIPGTKIVSGKSIYKGQDPGEGGRVRAIPGYYEWVALLDVVSMHPSTIIYLKLFGKEYTARFEDVKNARVAIKNGDFKKAEEILMRINPEIVDLFEKEGGIEKNAEALAGGLKTAINSAYGLTSAKFSNLLKDERNVDNIVAKRGALFMIDLEEEVESRGFKVVHTKTDSIKIPNATPEIISFVKEYGSKKGYEFDHEATYEKMCLVNESVYVAKYATAEKCTEMYDYIPKDCKKHGGEWTATGTQFQVPYVFKKLFSKEPIEFYDVCETKSVTTAIYIDYNENLAEEQHDYNFVGKVGLFCPVLPGRNGGLLVRKNDRTGKYDAVIGTKNKKTKESFRWLEADDALKYGDDWWKENVDFTYYDNLTNEAAEAINEYVDYIQFCEIQ